MSLQLDAQMLARRQRLNDVREKPRHRWALTNLRLQIHGMLLSALSQLESETWCRLCYLAQP